MHTVSKTKNRKSRKNGDRGHVNGYGMRDTVRGGVVRNSSPPQFFLRSVRDSGSR